jgi:hypothetical protein
LLTKATLPAPAFIVILSLTPWWSYEGTNVIRALIAYHLPSYSHSSLGSSEEKEERKQVVKEDIKKGLNVYK